MKTARELHVESHDPAVPEAYSAFMRTGWGDRELDLPRQPVADRAAAPARKAGRDVPRRATGAAGRHVQGAGQRHRLQVPPRHGAHLLRRQPDQRRGAGDRGRRVRPLRAAALGARHRRVLPRPPVRRAVGRAPPLAPRAVLLTRHRVPPHRPAPGLPDRDQRHPEDPGAARDLGRGGPHDCRRRLPRRGPPARGRRAAADQGRLGGRRAPGGLRHHRARLRGLGAGVEAGPRVRRALDRGHLPAPRPRDGQRHRLRLDRRRWQARHHAALDRQHRPDHSRAAGAARHGRRGTATSTPPT